MLRRIRPWPVFPLLVLAACGPATALPTVPAGPPIVLTSSAFAAGGPIPERHGFYRENVSPPLSWSGEPAGTQTLVLLVEDLDYPFSHWVLYDIPAGTTALEEGHVPAGARQGKNTSGTSGYAGPYPPVGVRHRYAFILYALDAPLRLAEGATREEVLQAMAGHVLARGELIGTYVGVGR